MEHLAPSDRARRGREARAVAPRSCHAAWEPPADRRGPVEILLEQATTRVPELVPIRHSRMLDSEFGFFRGAAAVMASDLASTPTSGLQVQSCGDAHLVNFGGFASPDRRLIFRVNDFDETLPGPWEWDVKRLAASIEVAARANEIDDATRAAILRATGRTYREAMREFACTRNLDLWYLRLDARVVMERWSERVPAEEVRHFGRSVAKAHHHDSMGAYRKFCRSIAGEPRIVSQPPLIVRLDELWPEARAEEIRDVVEDLVRNYTASLEPSRRHLLRTFRVVDVARKVVGVGSVGTRTWIVLLSGRDDDDPLFLQVKEAESSVLERYVGASEYDNHGRRVVEGQKLMQAAPDILLGWHRSALFDGEPHDYYVRQLWDWKMSANIGALLPGGLQIYAEMCAWTLARAHARSGDRIAIASYLGGGDVFDRALATFATTYADQNQRDFEAATAAAAADLLPCMVE